MASCSESQVSQTETETTELATQQDIKMSKVMRIGRYTYDVGYSSVSGTVIIFENGDYLKSSDSFDKDSKSEFACALKEGDVVSYKKNKKGLQLLKVESFANAQ
jgi:hypothetical protein